MLIEGNWKFVEFYPEGCNKPTPLFVEEINFSFDRKYNESDAYSFITRKTMSGASTDSDLEYHMPDFTLVKDFHLMFNAESIDGKLDADFEKYKQFYSTPDEDVLMI